MFVASSLFVIWLPSNSAPISLGKSWAGGPTFSFSGPSDVTANQSTRTALGTNFTAHLSLDMNSATTTRFYLVDVSNGTSTLPQGAKVIILANNQASQIQFPDGQGPLSTNNPIFALHAGVNAVMVVVAAGQNVPVGQYSATIGIATFQNSSATFVTYASQATVSFNA